MRVHALLATALVAAALAAPTASPAGEPGFVIHGADGTAIDLVREPTEHFFARPVYKSKERIEKAEAKELLHFFKIDADAGETITDRYPVEDRAQRVTL